MMRLFCFEILVKILSQHSIPRLGPQSDGRSVHRRVDGRGAGETRVTGLDCGDK